jgi:DNA-binding NarL/FixJ family response regulator
VVSMNLKEELIIFAGLLKVLCISTGKESMKQTLDGIFEHFDESFDGHDLLKFYQQTDYDVILCDLNIPDMDMIEELAKIRQVNKFANIIVFSEEATKEQLIRLINLKLSGYIPKPCSEEQLLKQLITVCEDAYYNRYFKESEPDESKEEIESVAEQSVQQETIKIAGDLRESIRHTIHDKIDALNFVSMLTPEEYEKVADFNDELDSFYVNVSNLKYKSLQEVASLLPYLSSYFNNFYTMVNNIYRFPIISTAFYNFSEFLYSIKPDEIHDREKVDFLLDSMLGLIGDFQGWIENVFIQQNTNNVNYLDASFASTCVEIEAIFRDKQVDRGDDEEEALEFF